MSHRNPLVTQVTVWRGNASRRKLREASASSMGIRAVRSRSSCGQPCEGIGFTSGSAQWDRRRRSGNRAANEGSTARATYAMGRASMFRATEVSMLAPEHRRPVQLGLLHRSGNRVARWLCCSGAPYGWAVSTPGKPGEEAARRRRPRAVRLVSARRATETTAAASWCGRPVPEVDRWLWETGAEDRLRSMGDPRSEV
jgi:hypothetical protein